MAADQIRVPNGFSVNTLDLGIISSLGMQKPDNYGEFVKLYPDDFRDFFITSLEAQGNLKATENRFFDQWLDANKPYPSFLVAAPVSGIAGAAITVTLTTASDIDGTLSPPAAEHLYVDVTTGIEYIIISANKDTANAHTAVIKPTLAADVPSVTTSSVLQWVGTAPEVEASDYRAGIYRGMTKRKRYLSTYATSQRFTDRATMEVTHFMDKTLYDINKTMLQKDHNRKIEYGLMRGKIRDNIASATAENNQDEGLIKQIERYGTDLGNAVTFNDAFFKNISRVASGNGYIKDFTMLAENTVSYAVDDYLANKVGYAGGIVYGNFDGANEIDLAFNFGKFSIYNANFKFQEYKLFNAAYTGGADPEADYYDTGRFLLIPNGSVIHPDQTTSKMVTVRYQAFNGMINAMSTDGAFFGKNTKQEGIVSVTSHKGLETYNIEAYFSGVIA
jgi:hypothetical protein